MQQKDGHCLNCLCVKANRPCSTCLPSRLPQCSNLPSQANSTSLSHTSLTTVVSHVQTPNPLSPVPSTSSTPLISPNNFTASPPNSVLDPIHPPLDSSTLLSSSLCFYSIATTMTSSQPAPTLLPPFLHMDETNFTWGILDGTNFSNALTSGYNEVIQWRRNLFSRSDCP